MDLDEHYSSVHLDFLPIQCTECSIFCPDRQQLNVHLDWHKNEDRDTKNYNFVSICCYCGKFFATGLEFDNHNTTCTENGTLDKREKGANNNVRAEIQNVYISLHIHPVPHRWSTWRQTTPWIQPGRHLKVTQAITFFAKLSLIHYIVTASRTTTIARRT